MRVRLRVAVTICASVVALAVAPTIANACPSLANVNAYQGHTATFFDAQGSGSDVGNGGSYAAQWERNVAHASVDLTHKQVIRNQLTGTHVIFSGEANGGTVTIDDTFNDTGVMWGGQERYSEPLVNLLPEFARTVLFLDLNTCQYQVFFSFNVKTALSGNAPWSSSSAAVSGGVYSPRLHITRSLKLANSSLSGAYSSCPSDPLSSGSSCYQYGGGLIGLCGSLDLVAANCSANKDPVDTGSLAWILSPKFSHPKKK